MSSPFYVTFSGVQIYPGDIKPSDISIEDIAHHLTKIQRFGGALPLDRSYSVAEHSIYMAEWAIERGMYDVAKHCLLHDSTEAYLGDVVSPLKAVLPDYKELEEKLASIIYSKYGISNETEETVRDIDRRILLDEVLEFIPHQYRTFQETYPKLTPLDIQITYYSPKSVYSYFIYLSRFLGIKD